MLKESVSKHNKGPEHYCQEYSPTDTAVKYDGRLVAEAYLKAVCELILSDTFPLKESRLIQLEQALKVCDQERSHVLAF